MITATAEDRGPMVGCLPSELEMDVEVWNSRSAPHRIHGLEWMKVAKSELTFSMPIFAKIAVSAANTADITAQNCLGNGAPSIANCARQAASAAARTRCPP